MASDVRPLEIRTLNAPAFPPAGQTKARIAFRDAVRLQQSFTARSERAALAWLAVRLPPWVHSDHLTITGFVAMFLAGASYVLARRHSVGLLLAVFCLALNWFGDSLDGTLARVRNRQRPRYGFYVDHVIDTVGGLFLMGGLALSGHLDWRVALAMYVAFLMLSIESYLATHALGTFRLSYGKFGPTEIRILLALGSVTLWFDPAAGAFGYRLFDLGGVVAVIGMILMFAVSAVSHTVQLYREEPLK
jgi:phosphatidylglycerophosphate synthase